MIDSQANNASQQESSGRPGLVSPFWRIVYIGCGFFFVGLGLIGAYLPLVPTTPFLLLASYFFLRSWPAMNDRVQRIPVFGRYLRDWNEKQGVRLEVKWTATLACLGAGAVGVWYSQTSLFYQNLLFILVAIGVAVVWSLRTVR